SVQAIAVGPDGIYLGGLFNHVNGASRNNIVKLTATSALDATFNASTNGVVSRMALDGASVFIGGKFLAPRTRLARLSSATGAVDPSWNPSFPWVVTWLEFFDFARVDQALIVSNRV